MEWISVKDRFPDHDDRYLVYEPGVGVYEAFTSLANGQYFWRHGYLSHRDGITHWMLMPAPPEVTP